MKVETRYRGQKTNTWRRNKIILTGNSHALGCAAEIKLNLDEVSRSKDL